MDLDAKLNGMIPVPATIKFQLIYYKWKNRFINMKK